jgi:hypothetical protein
MHINLVLERPSDERASGKRPSDMEYAYPLANHEVMARVFCHRSAVLPLQRGVLGAKRSTQYFDSTAAAPPVATETAPSQLGPSKAARRRHTSDDNPKRVTRTVDGYPWDLLQPVSGNNSLPIPTNASNWTRESPKGRVISMSRAIESPEHAGL